MSIMVLGGTGFIGEYLCRELTRRGQDVIAIGRPEKDRIERVSGVRYESIDLDANPLDLQRIMRGVDKIVFALQPDVFRTKKIISALSLFDDIKKIVYLSTALVYPDSHDRQDEKTKTSPGTEYEKNKVEEEKMFTEAAKHNNWQLSIARLGNVYGDVKNRGVVNGIIMALLNGLPIYIDDDGKNLRDFVFVENVAKMLGDIIVGDSLQFSGIFNVCTGIGNTVISVIENLEKISGKKANKIFRKDAASKNMVGDNRKIMEVNGEAPQSLAEGLKKTYNNYLKYYRTNKI